MYNFNHNTDNHVSRKGLQCKYGRRRHRKIHLKLLSQNIFDVPPNHGGNFQNKFYDNPKPSRKLPRHKPDNSAFLCRTKYIAVTFLRGWILRINSFLNIVLLLSI